MSWVLQTIDESEAAARFVPTRYDQGRKFRSQHAFEGRKTTVAAPSRRRCLQFLAALYIHMLTLGMLVLFSRNTFSAAIRTVLLPLIG